MLYARESIAKRPSRLRGLFSSWLREEQMAPDAGPSTRTVHRLDAIKAKRHTVGVARCFYGSGCWTRTSDPLINRLLAMLLSAPSCASGYRARRKSRAKKSSLCRPFLIYCVESVPAACQFFAQSCDTAKDSATHGDGPLSLRRPIVGAEYAGLVVPLKWRCQRTQAPVL
jgi:hypothetical protein